MNKLELCPFCGRRPELRHNDDGFSYVICANDGCYVRTDGHLNEEAAIAHWNKRVLMQKHLSEIERLKLENHNLCVEVNILKDFINGAWVDTESIKTALNIDFSTGLKLFDFSRTAEWNPAPLNGQKITTKFRLSPRKAIYEFWDKLRGTKFTHKNLGELIYVEDGDKLLEETLKSK